MTGTLFYGRSVLRVLCFTGTLFYGCSVSQVLFFMGVLCFMGALFYGHSVFRALCFTGAILIVYIFRCAGNLRVPVKQAIVCASNIISLITNIAHL